MGAKIYVTTAKWLFKDSWSLNTGVVTRTGYTILYQKADFHFTVE